MDDSPKDNVILITTLETNIDQEYDKVSKAPLPSKRYEEFKNLAWERKTVTIEPIIEFDHDIFLNWIININPETVWIGYNSRPKSVQLNEPSLEKTKEFIEALRKNNIIVKEKEMRESI